MYHQIQEIIVAHPECVCLIQVGSFYELYFDQAQEYGPKLSLKVAIRKTTNFNIPMAGFPCSQLQKFVRLLVCDHEVTVAIIDQFAEDAGATRLFSRRISRIVSPGTLVDETFLNYNQNNYLLAIHLPQRKGPAPPDPATKVGLAWIDVSVGEFHVQETTLEKLPADLARIAPAEIILPKHAQHHNLQDGSWYPPLMALRRYFLRYHKTSHGHTRMLKGDPQHVRRAIEALQVGEEAAMNMALSYVSVNLPGANPSLEVPTQHVPASVLQLDARTRLALELTERAGVVSSKPSATGTLLLLVRRTCTPLGARLLAQWIKAPLVNEREIARRHDFVDAFLQHRFVRLSLRQHLSQIGDFVRPLQQLAYHTGDSVLQLRQVGDGIAKLQALRDHLQAQYDAHPDDLAVLGPLLDVLIIPHHIALKIDDAIGIDNPVSEQASSIVEPEADVEDDTSTGKMSSYANSAISKYRTSASDDEEAEAAQAFVVRRDYNPEFKELHREFAELEAEEQRVIDTVRTTIHETDALAKLVKKQQHLRFQNVLFVTGKIRTIQKLAQTFGDDVCLQKKQSLTLNPRGWADVQMRADDKRNQILEKEREILQELTALVFSQVAEIRAATRLVDFLDVTLSFAIIAEEQQWVRPRFVKTKLLSIQAGRHVVVEAGLKSSGKNFTPNDTSLTHETPLWVISGPNMGGKSTFLRQNALIVILAQCGSFVPAARAKLSIVDKVFTRIGALDDLYSDLSTFMVEMIETSAILRHATPQSLAIVDEIGRGTGGKEGLAIAYATLVALLRENRCRTLFATHFGTELNAMLAKSGASDLRGIAYMRTRMLKVPGTSKCRIIDHALEPGISDISHALEVARQAGFPASALSTAQKALEELSL